MLTGARRSVWRAGYDGQPLGIIAVLPPFIFTVALASVFPAMGVRTGVRHVHDFEPTSSVSFITASAAGGWVGKLQIPMGQTSKMDEDALRLKLRLSEEEGWVKAADGLLGEGVR